MTWKLLNCYNNGESFKAQGADKRKWCITNLFVERAVTGVEWIFNDSEQGPIFITRTDCQRGALCSERAGFLICAVYGWCASGGLVYLFLVTEKEGDGKRHRHSCLLRCCCCKRVRNKASCFSCQCLGENRMKQVTKCEHFFKRHSYEINILLWYGKVKSMLQRYQVSKTYSVLEIPPYQTLSPFLNLFSAICFPRIKIEIALSVWHKKSVFKSLKPVWKTI